MYGQQVPGGRPQDFERVSRTVHVGGIGGLGETITENDVADFFGQQGPRARRSAAAAAAPRDASRLLGLQRMARNMPGPWR